LKKQSNNPNAQIIRKKDGANGRLTPKGTIKQQTMMGKAGILWKESSRTSN